MSSIKKYTFLLFLCLFSVSVFAQNKQFDKANKRYKLKKYAEAIPLYEQGLKIDNSLNAKARLAFCHRMTNNVAKAEELYSEIVSHERCKPKTWLYYGETLMMAGKYVEAKKWFEKYTQKKPDDEKGWEHIAQLENMQKIKPYFNNTKTEPFAHNSDADDSAPLKYNNGLVFSSDRKQGVKLLKKRSGWTGRDFINIYFSELNEDGTYNEPKAFPKKINATNKNCGNPTFSPDGKTMVFSRNSDWATKRGDYNIMLFSAETSGKGKWKNIEMLSFCNLNANYMHPAFSVTGDTLFYVSNRPGGLGGTDIFYSYKKKNKWTRPKNLSNKINTTSNEGYPFVDAHGKLFFCSKGHTGYGGFDIFYAKQDKEGVWQTPVNVGFPINSSHDDISIYVEKDGQSGMFASSRDGEDDNIFIFTTNHLRSEVDIMPIVDRATEKEDVSSRVTIDSAYNVADVGNPLPTENITIETQVVDVETVELMEEGNIGAPKVVEIEKSIEVEEIIENSSSSAANPILEQPKKEIKEPEITSLPNAERVVDVSAEEIMKEELIDLIPVDNEVVEAALKTSEQESTISNKEEEEIEKMKKELVDLIPMDEEVENSDSKKIENTEKVESHNNLLSSDDRYQSMSDFLSNNANSINAIYVLNHIKFSPEQFKITDEIVEQLSSLVELLRLYPEIKLEIGAHTESLGNDKKNMVISIKRATAIAGHLIRKGIDRNRLQVMGYGETQLINHCSNEVTCTQEEHFENHRIVLKVVE